MMKETIGFVLSSGKKEDLFKLCKKYGVTTRYDDIFTDGIEHYLWLLRDNDIGLIGTIGMMFLQKNGGRIIRGIEELEDYLRG